MGLCGRKENAFTAKTQTGGLKPFVHRSAYTAGSDSTIPNGQLAKALPNQPSARTRMVTIAVSRHWIRWQGAPNLVLKGLASIGPAYPLKFLMGRHLSCGQSNFGRIENGLHSLRTKTHQPPCPHARAASIQRVPVDVLRG